MPRPYRRMPPTCSRPATAAEAAAHYGVTVKTIRRWMLSGLLTTYRVGPRLVRVDLDEVERLARPIPADNLSA